MESVELEKDYKTEKKERKYKMYIDPSDGLKTVEIPIKDYMNLNPIVRNSIYGLEPIKFKLV